MPQNTCYAEHLSGFPKKLAERFPANSATGADVAQFIDTLVDKIFFTRISVSDELNAFIVFETLNARGVQLSATDLLKNFFFAVLSKAPDSEPDVSKLETSWQHILTALGNESFPDYLRVHWSSTRKMVRKTELFKVVRRTIATRDQTHQLIQELDVSAEIYAALLDPSDRRWSQPIHNSLAALKMFNARQHLPCTLANYAAFFDQDQKNFARLLQAVVTLTFRYSVVCGRQSSHLESLYGKIARQLRESSDLHAALTGLSTLYPNDADFVTSFATKQLNITNSRNRRLARYILSTLQKQNHGLAVDIEDDSWAIEHILPRSSGDAWPDFDDTQAEEFVHRIGNYTWLEKNPNQDLGNADYETKKQCYAQSGSPMTQDLAHRYDAWTPEKITSRQEHLAKVAKTIWRIDFPNG